MKFRFGSFRRVSNCTDEIRACRRLTKQIHEVRDAMTSDTKDALNQLAEAVQNARVALDGYKAEGTFNVRQVLELGDRLDAVEDDVIEIWTEFAAIERATE
jgi:hypothetical protein